MITNTLDYLRRNAIAITALGCALLALAGAGYAAISLPSASVGTRQLRNGAVTPAKLNRDVSGVRAWAVIEGGTDRVEASSTTVKVQVSPISGVNVWFRREKLPRRSGACSVVATPSTDATYAGSGHVQIDTSNQLGYNYFANGVPLSVDVVC